MKAQARRFLFAAGNLRALAETTLLGVALLAFFSRVVFIERAGFGWQVVVMTLPVLSLYAALRLRLPAGPWRRQVWIELLTSIEYGFILSAAGTAFIYLASADTPLARYDTFGAIGTALAFGAVGLGLLALRVAVRLWRFWQALRQRRMVWALTHAQMLLVVGMAVLALIFFIGLALQSNLIPATAETANLPSFLVMRFLFTVFPVLGMMTLLTLAAILFLLPPSALFSYLFARRITRRLENLNTAAEALRQGDYTSRVDVSGQDEVARLQSTFNMMASSLQDAVTELELERDKVSTLLQSRRELVASVSHELRTPVATIRGHLESMQASGTDTLPAAVTRDLGVIQREIEHLQRLLDDLFTLSRAEVGSLSLDVRPIDLAAASQRVVVAMAPLAWQAGRVEILCQPVPDLAPALADETRYNQILVNLLRNATRFTPPGGIVAVSLENHAKDVRVQVRDTGEGIPAEQLPFIWERFYHSNEKSAPGREGSGLGLALVKELTEAMGGSVSVESQPGEGSTFTVTLPAAC